MAQFDKDPMTLTRYIMTEQQKHKEASGDMSIILAAIATACKAITSAVRRAGLSNLYGMAGGSNVQGEEVKKLDVLSNEIFINQLTYTKRVALLVSEENEEAIVVPGAENAKYVCTFDPLDGSSNIDCNVSVGSIFGVLRRPAEAVGRAATPDEALQPGTRLICAGYAAYGSSTQLVIAFQGDGVNIFTYDPTIGEFLLSAHNVRMPGAPGDARKPQTIYSCNEGNLASFPPYVQRFLAECKGGAKPYSARYVGSAVADVHRTLLYGGCFLYPATASAPSGKLRLLYESNPIALILETAGGKAVTGVAVEPASESEAALGAPGRVLELHPASLHTRCPLIIGSVRDVDRLLALAREDAAGAAAGGK